MKISSRFSIAIHTLLLIYFYEDKQRVTSNFIAGSVNTNPVVIRRILSQLKKAGIIKVLPGKNGSQLLKKPEEISLFEVFQAVGNIDNLFSFHEDPNVECPIGRNIHFVLDEHLKTAQKAMEEYLDKVYLIDLINEINRKEEIL